MSIEQPGVKAATVRVAFLSIVLVLLALAFLHVTQTHHAFPVLWHYVRGRAGNCTLAESFEGEALFRLQSENFDVIRASSRVLRRDGSLLSLEHTRWGILDADCQR